MEIYNLWSSILKNTDKQRKKYTILLPPPNVTGALHIGHFLNWSLQDLLARNAYIQGFYPNWIVGIDHAGIGAEFVVERELKKDNQNKHSIGRSKFLEKTLEWMKHSEALIQHQALEFGFFFDWSQKRYTMDAKYQKSVIEAFCKLFSNGLIKKNYRITNWDTVFQTALSDLEIVEQIVERKMYLIRYDGNDDESIIVATTRPETIFADAAICVNPKDERYVNLKSKTFKIPLINKEIPFIKDELCDIQKGTGVLKITPAHDKTDNIIGEKHNLQFVQIIDKNGCLFNVPKEFYGKKTHEAKELVIMALKNSGHLIEEQKWEGIMHFGEKSGSPIEIIMTDQWMLDVSAMAKNALKCVNNGEIEFIPDNLKTTFEHWMNNIKPWCISRQIWWGHQIPIWYKSNGEIICAKTEKEAKILANNEEIVQESDVLDTWFSAALWPIATQEEFVATDILVTGKDILFFWVARMIMFTLYFKKEIPFKKIYFNGIVRDVNRKKMSKTKGNVLNPLDIKQEYGQDALRFALIRKSSAAKDLIIAQKDIEDARAFCTKFKNATRFVNEFMNKIFKPNQLLDEWIENKIKIAIEKIKEEFDKSSFHEACNLIYDIFWNNFCSWYIEGLKFYPSAKAVNLLCHILKITHPIIPLVTEECYQTIQKNSSILNFSDNSLNSFKNNFEDIIKITKILRKMKIMSNLQHFCIPEELQKEELIKIYSKLQIVKNQNFTINISGIKICLEKKCVEQSKIFFMKEIEKLAFDLQIIENNLQKKTAPFTILQEWEQKKHEIIKEKNTLEEFVASINNN